MVNYYLAIDIGASSGRHILGYVENGRIYTEEIHRFSNIRILRGGHDCWNLEQLWQEILAGLQICQRIGKIPKTIGIDTWAVDYILLDRNDQLIGDAVSYRDDRTDGMADTVAAQISPTELYARTGIQQQPFNTIYQLTALKQEKPEQLNSAAAMLMIPDYFNFLLTGVKSQEYTNATSTNLVNALEKTWDMELIDRLGFPRHLFGRLSTPGTVIGTLTPVIQEQVGFNASVILPATHDTGSAFLAVPVRDDNAVYLSSGTWSLLGIENDHPITTMESLQLNFTNEGGAWYRYRYLKNIMGLWMIQSIRRELNGAGESARQYGGGRLWSFSDLCNAAQAAMHFPSLLNVNDPVFLAPVSMIDAVRSYCAASHQPIPKCVGELMQCVYRSLALCYCEAIDQLSQLTGKTYTSIHIVGGGCQDGYLNELTAQATGLPVYAGPVEGTAIGNLLVQMISGGDLSSLQIARNTIRESFEIKEVHTK